MMKHVCILLAVLAVASCRNPKCLPCEENAFYKALQPYLIWSEEWTNIYHNIYFFQKDSGNYFTIWIDYSYPSTWINFDINYINGSNNYGSLYNDQYIKIEDVDMLLITAINDSLPMKLIGNCKKYFASRDSMPDFPDCENDGSSYAMTFHYELVDGEYLVEQVEMDIDFFKGEMRGFEYYHREKGFFSNTYW